MLDHVKESAHCTGIPSSQKRSPSALAVGRLWYKMGLLLLILSVAAMLPGLGKDADAVGKLGGLLCFAQLPVMLYTIFPTERALKKTFDKDGNRK